MSHETILDLHPFRGLRSHGLALDQGRRAFSHRRCETEPGCAVMLGLAQEDGLRSYTAILTPIEAAERKCRS